MVTDVSEVLADSILQSNDDLDLYRKVGGVGFINGRHFVNS